MFWTSLTRNGTLPPFQRLVKWGWYLPGDRYQVIERIMQEADLAVVFEGEVRITKGNQHRHIRVFGLAQHEYLWPGSFCYPKCPTCLKTRVEYNMCAGL